MAQLTCKNLSIGYDSKIILNNINFEVNSGDYICIVGENGSGKSTLMKTILGLQPIISGKVFTGDGLKFNEIGYDENTELTFSCVDGDSGECYDIPFDEILKNVKERDYIDSHREIAPLKKAPEAIYIDSTGMTIEEEANEVIKIIEEKRR